ncbi:hypothetical protein AGMMS49982_23100 [Bacteroidia bacterium]|nr:hypothetical protein AGMMS49982_23100 [Bacteroidia bacterium]
MNDIAPGLTKKSVIAGLTRNPLTTITILLDHEPYNLEEAEAAGIDLQFSGHTHDEQLFPFNYITSVRFEVAYGINQRAQPIFMLLPTWGCGVCTTKYK